MSHRNLGQEILDGVKEIKSFPRLRLQVCWV